MKDIIIAASGFIVGVLFGIMLMALVGAAGRDKNDNR